MLKWILGHLMDDALFDVFGTLAAKVRIFIRVLTPSRG